MTSRPAPRVHLTDVVGVLSLTAALALAVWAWSEPEPHVVDDLLTPHIAGATR